jgi:Uma2 family endonuclease
MATLTNINTPLYEGRHVTREEYLDLPDDGFRYDMIEGVLYMSPSAFANHNRVVSRIIGMFEIYLNQNNTIGVFPETDVFLPDGKDVLRPDISVILKENYGIITGHIHGIPDIVVEVLSHSTRERDLGVKADRYLFNGIKECWIADPDSRAISLWINRNRSKWRKIEANDIESSVLNGLILKNRDLFINNAS